MARPTPGVSFARAIRLVATYSTQFVFIISSTHTTLYTHYKSRVPLFHAWLKRPIVVHNICRKCLDTWNCNNTRSHTIYTHIVPISRVLRHFYDGTREPTEPSRSNGANNNGSHGNRNVIVPIFPQLLCFFFFFCYVTQIRYAVINNKP